MDKIKYCSEGRVHLEADSATIEEGEVRTGADVLSDARNHCLGHIAIGVNPFNGDGERGREFSSDITVSLFFVCHLAETSRSFRL